MVFPGRSNHVVPAGKQGEVALTLAVLSVLIMIVGTVAGLGVSRTQDIRSSAAGTGQYCGLPCTTNANCGTDRASGSRTQCDFSKNPRICVSVNTPDNPRCPTGLKTCGESCSADRDCNAPLTCDRNKKVCAGAVCPAAEPTASSTGGTKRGGDICDPNKNECVAGFYCGRPGGLGTPYTCQPGLEGGGTAVPTGPIYQGSADPNNPVLGNSFTVRNTSECEIDWSFEKDPRVEELYLQAGANKFDFVRESPIPGVSYNGAVSDAVVSFRNGGVYIGFDPSANQDVNRDGKPDIILRINLGGGTVRTWYFNRPNPDWLGTQNTLVYIKYSGQIASQTRWWYQSSNVSACRVSTITPPTVTPSITFQSSCGGICTEDLQCKRSDARLVCRKKGGQRADDPTKYCLLPAPNDSPDCRATTVTPSVVTPSVTTPTRIPSLTRTPTPTATPSATPTPATCNANIHFLMDASETVQTELTKYKTDIDAAVRSYGNDPKHKNDQITFTTSFFARDIHASNKSFTPLNFDFPIQHGLHWTNLKAALESVSGPTILISDGLPSVVRYGSNNSAFCVYGQGDIMQHGGTSRVSDGCDPIESTGTLTDRSKGTCAAECMTTYKYNDAYADSKIMSHKDDIYGIFVDVGFSDSDFMSAVSSEVINVPNLPSKIAHIFDSVCAKERSKRQAGLGSNRPRTFMSSFTVQNQSNKSVQSVNVKTCNQAGGNCQTFLNTVGVAPQSTGRFSQVIPDSVPASNRAIVTCDVNYTDGSSLPCPKKQTQNESVQFNLTVNNKAVAGSTKTFLQAADVNNDGRVNGIDYVLCQKQIATTGTKSCDIVSDDLVNAQDISVVAERLGQATK